MQRDTYELMQDQVTAIYRAVTGTDLPKIDTQQAPMPAVMEDLARRFADLETWARLIPQVSERVPPFAFTPPVDIIEDGNDLRIELAVPGVKSDEVRVELTGDVLVVSGTRAGEKAANGRVFRHAEIPRGPFRRVVQLPHSVSGPPRIETQDGLVRIHLSKGPMGSVTKAKA